MCTKWLNLLIKKKDNWQFRTNHLLANYTSLCSQVRFITSETFVSGDTEKCHGHLKKHLCQGKMGLVETWCWPVVMGHQRCAGEVKSLLQLRLICVNHMVICAGLGGTWHSLVGPKFLVELGPERVENMRAEMATSQAVSTQGCFWVYFHCIPKEL